MSIYILIIVIITTGLVGFTYCVFLRTVLNSKGKTKTKWKVILLKLFQIEFESEYEDNSEE